MTDNARFDHVSLWLAVDVAEVCQQLGTAPHSTVYDRLRYRMDQSTFNTSVTILRRAGLIQTPGTVIIWTGGRGPSHWPLDPSDPRD